MKEQLIYKVQLKTIIFDIVPSNAKINIPDLVRNIEADIFSNCSTSPH